MLLSIALILICAIALSQIAQKLKLPSLIGMLITGIILGPHVLDLISPQILDISADLRQIALIIILLRAGLSLDLNDLKKAKRPAILMCFIPATVEIAATTIALARVDTYTPGGGTTEPTDPVVNITKQEITHDNFSVKYAVNVTAENGGKLNGLTVVDNGPASGIDYSLLNMSGASVIINGDPSQTLNYQSYLTGNVFTYTFDTTGDDITSAVFELEYFLSDAVIEKFFHDGYNVSVSNKAELHDMTKASTLIKTTDPAVYTSFSGKYMTKKSSPDTSNPSRIKWEIEIDTKFTHATNAYLVDYISDNQKYDGAIEVNFNNSPLASYDVVGTTPISVNIGGLNAENDIMNNESYYFSSGTTNLLGGTISGGSTIEGISADGSKIGFVIPLSEQNASGDTALGGKYYIVYYTVLTESSQSGYSDNVYGNNVTNALNNAYVTTKHICVGNGPNPHDYDSDINVAKKETINYNIYSKKYNGYNAKTQTLTWNFDINRYGVAYDYIMIEDDISSKCSLADYLNAETAPAITLTPYSKSGAKGTPVNLVYRADLDETNDTNNSSINVNCYKIIGNKIYFYLVNILDTNYYILAFDVKVTDGSFLTSEQNEGNVTAEVSTAVNAFTNSSKAYVSVKDSGTSNNYSSNIVTKFLPNALITKASNGYDITNHTSKWTINANINKVPLKDMKLVDFMPEGTSFKKIDSIKCNGVAGTISADGLSAAFGSKTVTWAVSDKSPSASTYNDDKMTFTFCADGEICADNFEIVVILETDPDFRLDFMGKGENCKLTNKATLYGEVNGVTIGADAGLSKTAYVDVNYNRVQKTGEYDRNATDVTWTAYVNTDNVNLGGKLIKDDLSTNAFLEMCVDENAIKVYKATRGSDGKWGYSTTDDITSEFTVKELEPTHFILEIPAAPSPYATQAFAIVFKTNIVKSPGNAGFTNSIALYSDGTGGYNSNANSGLIATDDYNYGNACKNSPKPKLTLTKKNKDGGFLNNATYAIDYSKTLSNGSVKNYTMSRITGSTGENGLAYFTSLPVNTVLTLSETTAPLGYERSSDMNYYVFLAEGKTAAWFKGTAEYTNLDDDVKAAIKFIPYNATSNEAIITCINIGIGQEPIDPQNINLIKEYGTLDLEQLADDAPDKLNEMLSTTEFTLYKDVECTMLAGTATTSVASPVWNVSGSEPKAVVTFDSSVITTNKTYYLKETKAPYLHTASDNVYVCDVKQDGTVWYKVISEDGTETAYSQLFPTCVNARIPTADIVFKNKSTTGKNLENTKFGLYNPDGTLVDQNGTDAIAYSDANGDVVFYDVPEGDYYIKEIELDTDEYMLNAKYFNAKVVVDNGVAEVTFEGKTELIVYNEPNPVPSNSTQDNPYTSEPKSENVAYTHPPVPNKYETVATGAGVFADDNIIGDVYNIIINAETYKLVIALMLILGNIYIAISESRKNKKSYRHVK